MATVIRVKRRRVEKPAEALLVVSKAKAFGANHRDRREIQDEGDKKIFHFATTVKSKSPMSDEIKERVRSAILLRQKQNKQLRMGRERPRHFLQDKNSLVMLKEKLKNMAISHHHHFANKEPPSRQTVYRRSSPPAKVPNYSNSSHKLRESHRKGNPYLYKQRLLPLPEDHEKMKPEIPSHSGRYMGQDIKRAAQKVYPKQTKDDEYVYDLYYCQKTGEWNVKDVLYVKPYEPKDLMMKPIKTKNEKQAVMKKVFKPGKRKLIKRGPTPDGDDDRWGKVEVAVPGGGQMAVASAWTRDSVDSYQRRIDDDERRFIFDEEEDFYDSDDYDVNGRDDDDSFTSHFGGGLNDYDNESNFDNYDDNLENDLAAYEPDYSFANDNCDDYGGNDDNN